MRILADENLHFEIVQGLRRENNEVFFVPEIGLAGRRDSVILDYAEKRKLIVVSGDKDFGGLIEFGTLWGRGKVILLRYHIINPQKIVRDLNQLFGQEDKILLSKESLVIILSESGYRIRKHVKAKK